VVLFLSFMFYSAGRAHALKQTEYLFPSTYEQSVVLRIYGDNMICAPVDRDKKEVQRSFFVLNVSGATPPTLKLEKIGPLKSANN